MLPCWMVRWLCVPLCSPSSDVSQVKVWPRPHHTHLLLSVTDLAAHLPYLPTAMRYTVCLVLKLPWKPIPEARTNLGGEYPIHIGWDDSVFLIRYWLLIRLFQGNWCQWSSHCLRTTWVLVSKANSGIPSSEIPTHRPLGVPGICILTNTSRMRVVPGLHFETRWSLQPQMLTRKCTIGLRL